MVNILTHTFMHLTDFSKTAKSVGLTKYIERTIVWSVPLVHNIMSK